MAPFNLLLATGKNEVKNLDLTDPYDEFPNSSNTRMEEDVYPYGISNRIIEVREFNSNSQNLVGLETSEKKHGHFLEYNVLIGIFEVATVNFAGSEWDIIICNNTANLNLYGKPAIPYKKMLIPIGDAEIVNITIDKRMTGDIPKVKVLPGLKPLPVGFSYVNWSNLYSHLEKNFYIDPLLYYSNREFPSEFVQQEVVSFSGNRFLALTVFPFKFCPKNNVLRVFDVHVSIEFTEPVSMINQSQVNLMFSDENVGYVIIIPSEFSGAVESFAEWKEQLGFSVQITELEQIYGQFGGRDEAEKVRNFINESYFTNGTQYYFLVGDCDVCPAREVWDPVNVGMGCDNGTEPSDLYYECLDGDWDANGNSVFGELDDNVDLYPEVKVGRIPVNTTEDAERVLAMIRKTEESPESGEWIKNFLLIAPSAFTQGDGAAALEEEIYQKFLAGSFFRTIRLYDVDYSISPSAAISAINEGTALVDFFDHGAYDTWVGALRTSDVLNLTNGNRTFLAFAMACETAAFDYQEYTTISEAFFRNPNGGAISYIGATRIAWAGYDCFDGLHHRFWNYFLESATEHLEADPKQALQDALVEMVSTYDVEGGPTMETIYQAIYFGDPALNFCWKHNVTTTTTPNLETNENGVVNGTCSMLHSGAPITGEYKVVISDPTETMVAEKSGNLGSKGNYTVNFTTTSIPGNYTIRTTLTNPFNYTSVSTFTVGTLNVTVKLDSEPIYCVPLQVSGQVLQNGSPVAGVANISIMNKGVIVNSKNVSIDSSGQYQTEINLTTFGMQALHVWVSNNTKHGGTFTPFKVRRGDILIIAYDTGDVFRIYPGGWYDFNRGSSTSYRSFHQALTDEYNVTVYRIMYDPVPSLPLLQQCSAVIVTCGDHYGSCLTSLYRNLTQVLTQYHNLEGDLLFEGGDVAYSLTNRNYAKFMESVLHASFIQDLSNTDLYLNNTYHPITQGLPSQVPLTKGLGSPSVDLVLSTNGSEMVSGYAGYLGNSITAFPATSGLGSVVYFSFSVDGINNTEQRNLLIRNSIEYLLYPTLSVELSDYALRVNTSETIWIHVKDSNTKQLIEKATVTASGCGVSVQNETDNNGECSIFIAPTSAGVINVTTEKTGYPNFTNQIVVYSVPKLIAQITPDALRKQTQTVSIKVTDFYEYTTVDSVIVTLLGCSVSETGYTNSAGNIEFTVSPTSYGYIQLNASKYDYENYTSMIYVYVNAVVVDSFGTDLPFYSRWDDLNSIWQYYGTTPIKVDTNSLNKYGITYEDLVESEADVLIISCAATVSREYTDNEVSAIKQYVLEGHGLIATAGTLYEYIPNNNKLAPLFGMREDIDYDATYMATPSLNILDAQHPLFTNILSPYSVANGATVCPSDLSWNAEDLFGGTYVALSDAYEGAIIVNNGVVFITHWVEYMSNNFDLQLMYNAIVWSKYGGPEHDMAVTSLEVPTSLDPDETTAINVTISNLGLNTENNVMVQFIVNDDLVNSTIISIIENRTSVNLRFPWTAPETERDYNLTICVPPVSDEKITANNVVTEFVKVFTIKDKILLVVDDDGMFCTDTGVWPNEIISALEACGFRVFVWSEREMGRPALNHLLDALGVVWHCGTYRYVAVDYMDAEMLIQYINMGGSLVLEGENIGWDHGSDQFMLEVAHAFFGTDIAGYDFTVTAPTHPVSRELPSQFSIVVEPPSLPPFPDGVYPTNGGIEVVRYTASAYLGIVAFESITTRTVYISFSTHYLSSSIRDQLIENSVKYAVSRDNVPPTIFIASPEDGAIINATSVHVSWYGDDEESGIDHYSIYLNEGLIGNTNALITSWWIDSDLLQGPNNVTVVAHDKMGNYASDQITVIVDLIRPTAEIITPKNGSYLRDAVIIVVNGCDTHFDYMELYTNDGLIATFNDDGTNVYVWESSLMEDKTCTVKLVVCDKAENCAEAFVTVIVDNTSPEVTWISPSNGSHISEVANLTFSYYDSNLHEATLLLDGRTLANVTGENFYLWETSDIADGEHVVMLMVLDEAGNINATLPTIVTVDNTAPTAEVLTPEEGQIISGLCEVSFRCRDANLKNATLKIVATVHDVTDATEFVLNTTELLDGNYTVTLTVIDKAGNRVDESVTLVVDNTKPDVNIANSAELIGAELVGVVTVQFSSSDANLESVFLYIDETVVNVTGQSSYEWNTTEVGDGTHTMRLVAYDKARNMAETPPLSVRTVNVQKANQEDYWIGWDFGLKMGVVLGFSIGLVIGLAVLRALRKKLKV
jgi:hypothetical protein